MSELQECPFCGGEAVVQKSWGRVLIECDCNAKYGHGAYVVERTEAEAVEAWNTRHERTCRNINEYRDSNGVLHRDARLFKCSSCGFKADDFYGDDEESFPNYCPNCGRRCI